jgi:8-oxo-dGTP pyrophosphatase MutT (NUDIX family)
MSYTQDSDFLDRLRMRLDPLDAPMAAPVRSDFDLNPAFRPASVNLRDAAVLVPIVQRQEGLTILLTQRTDTMPTHAGQISFPGGRVQPDDDGPVAAALRETVEETGIAARHIEPIGRFLPYQTVTNYRITPIVALVSPDFELNPDPREVADVFETPVSFLMNAANHEQHSRDWQGQSRSYFVMPYQKRYIWGAPAGLLKALHDRLYGEAK